jgi:multiple sugar transport system substrate-binding protein
MKKTNVYFSLFLIVLLISLPILVLGSSKEKTEPVAPDKGIMSGLTKEYEGTVLNFVLPEGQPADTLRELANDYFVEATGIKINVNGYSYVDTHQKQVMDFMGKTGAIDVLGFVYQWFGEYVGKEEHLEPLNDYLNNPKYFQVDVDDYAEAIFDIYARFNDKLYGLPFIGDVEMLCYNKGMLDKAGVNVPGDWYELVKAAEKLTIDKDGDGILDQYGFSLMAGRAAQAAGTYTNILYSLGGQYINEIYEPQFDTKEGFEAMRLIVEDLRKVAPPDSTMWDYGEGTTAFLQGKMDPEQSTVIDEAEVTTFPTHTSLLGGWCLGINKYSENKDAAFYFISWFSTTEVQKKYVEIGGNTLNNAVLNDPEIVEKYPFNPLIAKAYQVAKPFPKIPETEQMIATIYEEVNYAAVGEKSIEEAVKDLDMRVYKLMEKNNRYEK